MGIYNYGNITQFRFHHATEEEHHGREESSTEKPSSRVETEEEFLAACLTHRPEVDGLVIEAPAKVGFRIGGDDVTDGSE